MWQKFLEDYLNFTKKERSGIIVLAFVIIVIILTIFFLPYFKTEDIPDHAEFKKELARLKIDTADKVRFKNSDEYYNDYTPNAKRMEMARAESFLFDPNTATLADWSRLGVKEKTALTIQKYIAKGGRFYKAEDIRKIWGLHASDAERLLPYVRIKETTSNYPPSEKPESQKTTNSFMRKVVRDVDINLADTLAFKELPGIGSKLSQRIVAFREKLGGFHSIEQVGETYFLPDSVFQKIKPHLIISSGHLKQININSASAEQLKSHPYIRYNLANAIISYRKQHGNFKSIDDLKKIMIFSEEEFMKTAPYFTMD
jgi:competence protein ComEA